MRSYILAFAVALLLPSAASAAEFWYVAEGQTYSFWVDAQTLKASEDTRTVMVYQIYSKSPGRGVRVGAVPAEFDCSKHRAQFLPGMLLGNDLRPVAPSEEQPEEAVTPRTVLAGVETFVCGSVADRAKAGDKFGDANTQLKDVVAAYFRTFRGNTP